MAIIAYFGAAVNRVKMVDVLKALTVLMLAC